VTPEDSSLPAVTIYTDGACSPNPGPGGWAAILLRPDGEATELCGAEPTTTNNQMELRAAVEALQALPGPHHITLYTDSEYLRQGMTEWLPAWERRGWQTAERKPVKNLALWQDLAAAVRRHHIDWRWVKGHTGDPWNERADALARSMIPAPPLPLEDAEAIHLFTAASCAASGTGPGGWGAILRYQTARKSLSGHEPSTSANRLHILAVVRGLQAVKRGLPIHVYTTSEYLHDGATRWLTGWQQRNWRTREGQPVRHHDLWQELLGAAASYHVSYHLVREGVLPDLMIECRDLARAAAGNRLAGSQTPQVRCGDRSRPRSD
jgi:ribonuclease HI